MFVCLIVVFISFVCVFLECGCCCFLLLIKDHWVSEHRLLAYMTDFIRLEKGSTIPLHDHPGMTVVSKLVYGEIAVRAFDPIGNAPVGM